MFRDTTCSQGIWGALGCCYPLAHARKIEKHDKHSGKKRSLAVELLIAASAVISLAEQAKQYACSYLPAGHQLSLEPEALRIFNCEQQALSQLGLAAIVRQQQHVEAGVCCGQAVSVWATPLRTATCSVSCKSKQCVSHNISRAPSRDQVHDDSRCYFYFPMSLPHGHGAHLQHQRQLAQTTHRRPVAACCKGEELALLQRQAWGRGACHAVCPVNKLR